MSALGPTERRWAEALFEAILGPVEQHGLPAFASVDKASFYEAIDRAPGPAFAPGLRAMVHAGDLRAPSLTRASRGRCSRWIARRACASWRPWRGTRASSRGRSSRR
ncbi:MAG: hypothetical protein M5U28_05015 [Sandaracinaceae bacterium]|nr:hypothetical protein [Sandaracinaceae bacterium]